MNGDGLVTVDDVFDFFDCLTGPDTPYAPGCVMARIDGDDDVDLKDAAAFCQYFSAP